MKMIFIEMSKHKLHSVKAAKKCFFFKLSLQTAFNSFGARYYLAFPPGLVSHYGLIRVMIKQHFSL